MASARASLRGDRPIPVAVRAGGHTVRSRPSTVKRSVAQSLRASLDDDEGVFLSYFVVFGLWDSIGVQGNGGRGDGFVISLFEEWAGKN